MYLEPSNTVNFSNLRAQLKSNKIFYVVINSFALLNCRPAIKNTDYITSQTRLLPKQKSLKQTKKTNTLSSNTNIKNQMELRFLELWQSLSFNLTGLITTVIFQLLNLTYKMECC